MMRISLFHALCLVLLSTTCGLANLIDVRVDFGDAEPDPTGNWTTVDTPGTTELDLVDFVTGMGSGVDLETNTDFNTSSLTNQWDNANPGPAWLDAPKDAANDYFWLNGGENDLGIATFSGLVPGLSYRVELIASSSSAANSDAIYSANGIFFDGSADGLFNFADGFNDGDWLIWSSVVADGSGEIAVSVDTTIDSNSRGRFNAIQLSGGIPEPTTAGLLAIAGLAILRRRRSRDA